MSSVAAELPAATATPRSRRRFTVDALFTDHRPQAVGVSDLPTAKEIRLDRIEPDPDQPRRTFDAVKLAELAESIRLEGVLQPIAVRYDPARDVYVVLHGERRWRASRAAGCDTIPALVRDVPEERRLIQQLMENIVRDDLNAVDRAAALRALKTQLDDAPWEQVAEAVGIRRSRLFQLLGTEKLPDAAREDIRAGRLSEKQSRALQGLPPNHQEALRRAIIAADLPAEDAMRLARALKAARVTDDPDAIDEALRGIRAASLVPPPLPDAGVDAVALLTALSAAAGGSRAARTALSQAADAAGAPPYSAQRLQIEVLAVARTLARAPSADLQRGGSSHDVLVSLREALDRLLTVRD